MRALTCQTLCPKFQVCFRSADGAWMPTGLSVKLQSAVIAVEINVDGKTQQAKLLKESGNAITFTGDHQVCLRIHVCTGMQVCMYVYVSHIRSASINETRRLCPLMTIIPPLKMRMQQESNTHTRTRNLAHYTHASAGPGFERKFNYVKRPMRRH